MNERKNSEKIFFKNKESIYKKKKIQLFIFGNEWKEFNL